MICYFKFEAEPSENNRYYGRVGYGEANIFVSCDDTDLAETLARTYIKAQNWIEKELVDSHAILEIGTDWSTELVELCQDAIRFGISGFFSASPKEDVPGGPTLLLRPY